MTMTPRRFSELAQAFGGDIRRWPAETHDVAYALLEAAPDLGSHLLEASELDALLNASAPAIASGVLRERILATAPRALPLWRRGGAWLSGASLAAACAAGVMLGVNMSHTVFVDPVDQALSETASAFDGASWFTGLEEEG